MIGNRGFGPQGRHDPSRTSPSQLPTPAEASAMRTSRGPGLGTGIRWSVSTAGGPNSSIAAAFMVCGIACRPTSAPPRFVIASVLPHPLLRALFLRVNSEGDDKVAAASTYGQMAPALPRPRVDGVLPF